ncbi:SPASM domain-containing protein [Anaerococcus sp. WCA-380-WT-2B]|uniref:SPASM domain-containing protein n=1 Tax=Anaerococcus porci TaxID=2652269 RepID=A0A6N7VTI3_9FIRM|nr:SPASM domain-containing protein [Anaerococcus porci]MSS77019.1 SPASM domain-containing protein [Anaerococcus porci]
MLDKSFSSSYYDDIFCDAGIHSFAIDPFLNIIPCHMFLGHGDYKLGEYNKGHIFNSKLRKITNILQSIRKFKRCKECINKNSCSVCPASILFYKQSKHGRLCEFKRKIKDKYIKEKIKESRS